MIKLEASFRIVTPLFMSGAKSNESERDRAELRAASIRGVLRFWWRALALGHRHGSWEEVRKAEFALFGSSSGGQSRVHLSLSAPEQSKKRCKSGDLLKDGSGKVLELGGRYIGYGIIDINGKAARPYLNAPLECDLKIYLRPPCGTSILSGGLSDEADLLEGALKAMGLLGGLGSRSRRGFGSLSLLELKRDGELRYVAPKNVDGYSTSLKDFFKKHVKAIPNMPDYTAFSQETRIYLLKTGEDPLQLLGEIGQAMQMYRSCGLRGMVNNVMPSENIFRDDHDNMRAAFSAPAKDYPYPRRVAFGLPHNYSFTSLDRKLTVLAKDHERRASPLFFHIQKLSDKEYAALASIFPTKFLPDKDCILIQPDQGTARALPLRSDWLKVLTDFVEGVVHNGTGMKRFPDLKIVLPDVAAEGPA